MAAERSQKIAAIVLAAGQSSRMGDDNKLLAKIRGKDLVRHAVDAALESAASCVVVVTGFEASRVEKVLKSLPVTVVRNRRYAQGLSTSLECGLAALPDDCNGVIVCLADMPDVNAIHLDNLISAFDPENGRGVCVSCHASRRGNPVLWSRNFFPDMMKLTGDEGARSLLKRYADIVCEVEMSSSAVLRDVDKPEDFVEWAQEKPVK